MIQRLPFPSSRLDFFSQNLSAVGVEYRDRHGENSFATIENKREDNLPSAPASVSAVHPECVLEGTTLDAAGLRLVACSTGTTTAVSSVQSFAIVACFTSVVLILLSAAIPS